MRIEQYARMWSNTVPSDAVTAGIPAPISNRKAPPTCGRGSTTYDSSVPRRSSKIEMMNDRLYGGFGLVLTTRLYEPSDAEAPWFSTLPNVVSKLAAVLATNAGANASYSSWQLSSGASVLFAVAAPGSVPVSTCCGAPPIWALPPSGLPASAQAANARVVSRDRKSTRLNSSHGYISYAVF